MSMSSIQGMVLDLSVTGCRNLRDTEIFSRQDPYVIVEYASTKLRTRTCTDGGKNPSFDDKFQIPLIEGLRELNVLVWNSNTINRDGFIGSCKVPLNKVLTSGYDDSSWSIQTRRMKSAGEVKLIMHFDITAMKNKMGGHYAPSMPAPSPYTTSYPAPSAYPTAPPYQAYPTPGHAPPYHAPPSAYPAPPPQQQYQHQHHAYPPHPYGQPYPPQPYGYGQPYPPPPSPTHSLYPPPSPTHSMYPPPSPTHSMYPPAPYPGAYPPPSY